MPFGWLDFNFIQMYTPMYAQAILVTLCISAMGIVLSFALGLFCAVVQYYRVPFLRKIVVMYIELSRNTPLIIQLFFLYFAFPKLGIVWSAEVCGVVGLAFLGGSYIAETLRSGLESVDKSQLESAKSLGFSKLQTVVEIILPQAFAVSVPGLCANVIFLIKETSIVSAIALADLMYVARELIGLYYETDEILVMLVVSYLIILLPISVLGWILERRLRYAVFGN